MYSYNIITILGLQNNKKKNTHNIVKKDSNIKKVPSKARGVAAIIPNPG